MNYTVASEATMKIDYNLLKTFVKVVELGSFTAAADALKQPKSRVSRAIARLESDLDVQLIRRTTRKTSLTTSGQGFYKNISPLLKGIDRELETVSELQQEMSGVIRVTASPDIAQTILSRVLAAFNARYPKVSFDTIIGNQYLDLTKENIDVAFRAGKLDDSTLIQRKVIAASFILVCSPKYLETRTCPESLHDLIEHKFLSFRGIERSFPLKKNMIDPVLTSDSLPMLLSMVKNGDGVSALPDFFCREYLDTKQLIRLIPSWKSKTGNIQIVYSPNRNMTKRLRKFVDFVAELHH